MKPTRLKIVEAMIVVAVVALELGAIKAFASEFEEYLLLDLPTANILVFVGIVGFRSHRARIFALGFVVVGTLSLLAFHAWVHMNPWTFLRYFEPPFRAIERRVEDVWPDAHFVLMYVIVIFVFAIPHTLLGLAGGYLAAKGWAIIARRDGA